MSHINVIMRTQKIVVDPASRAVAVINAGPQGPGGPTGPAVADGDKGDVVVSGGGTVWTIDALSVTTGKLADLAVTAAKIANDTITAAQIAANAITASELADNAVDTNAIAALAVTNGKLADLAVGTAKIADDAVNNAKLANMNEANIKGRAVGAGTGDPQNLSGAQVLAIIEATTPMATQLDLDTHISSLTAHPAANITVADTADHLVAANVEAALAELASRGDQVPLLRWPDPIPANISITQPDPTELAGATALDIRWIERGRPDTGSGYIIAQSVGSGAGNLSFHVNTATTGRATLLTSTGGAAGVTGTVSDNDFRPAAGVVGTRRITWRASDGRIQYFKKDTVSVASMKLNTGWTQHGTDEVGAVGPLTDVALALSVGSNANGGTGQPGLELRAVQIATTIDGTPFTEFVANSQVTAEKKVQDQFGKVWTVNIPAASRMALINSTGTMFNQSLTTDARPASSIAFTPTGTISSTDVQAAIAEVSGDVTALTASTVPTSRTISTTAPLTGGGDLSANRTLAISSATESAVGVVELATATEVQAGTDGARVPSVLALATATSPSALGAEMLTNPGFTGGSTGWTLGGGATYGTDNINLVDGATIEQTISVTNGSAYHIGWTDTSAAGTVRVELGTVSSGEMLPATTLVTLRANTTGSVTLKFTYTTPTAASVLDAVSMLPVTENLGVPIAGTQIRRAQSTSVAIGVNAHRNHLSTGSANVALGNSAQSSLSNGTANIGIGASAQLALSSGTHNVGVGYLAQTAMTTGAGNVGIGYNAQAATKTSQFQVAIGYNSQAVLTTGVGNTAVGALTQDALTTGSFNTAVGYNAQTAMTTGGFNTAFGYAVQSALTTGVSNLGMGVNAQLALTTGNNNVGVGQGSQQSLTTGGTNTAVGNQTQLTNQVGASNVAVGYNAQNLMTSSFNVGVGFSAQASLTSGGSNTAVGTQAMNNPNGVIANATTTASFQTCIGMQSGLGSTSQDNEIVCVGYNATAIGLGSIAIGSSAAAGHAGSVAIGRSTTTTTVDQVNVGTRDIEIMGSGTKGLIMKSPNGTRYRITIANGGTLVVTAAP